MRKIVVFALVISGLLSACISHNNGTYRVENRWIYNTLSDYYLWYDEIDNGDIPTEMYPEDYFYSLLYDEKDHWSYISDDYEALETELEGTPTSMGYSPAFGYMNGTTDVFMIVEYVYPDSPADRAGLKRGDIVVKVNGTQLNEDNYADLFYASSQVLTLGEYVDSYIQAASKKLTMVAEVIEVDPVLFDTVYSDNGISTGYMVITEFISPETFDAAIDESFASFKSAGISELIIDLRYNGGGYISSAQWLASSIVKSEAYENEQVLTYLEYNDKVDALLSSDEKQVNFTTPNISLNLNKVYFLTTSGTASASELVIVGLQPYIDVVTVGENSHGKYTGMWLIPDTQDPPRHNWAMLPVVLRYSNASGYTDFEDGLTPNYYVDDNLLNSVPFGDTSDPVLAQALYLTNGVLASLKQAKMPAQVKWLSTPGDQIRNNLFVK